MMHHFRQVLICLFCCLTGFVSATPNLDLPDLGDSGLATLTPAQEKRTGATVVRNLRRAGLIVDDPLLTDYLNQLGYNLLAHHDKEHATQFEFFLVNDSGINAFALPGGYIGINYGLIRETESESELASVIAHEIAHVTQRHYARAYSSQSGTELPVLAAIIAAIILGSQSSELGSAALASIAASTAQSQINFTRQNEYEADRIGISILSSAGYDPEKMANFFEKLDKESRLYGINVPEFLRTHPVNENRISDARGRARLLPKTQYLDSLAYHLMRQRIVALASRDKQRSEKQYKEEVSSKKGAALTASRYGYVLNLMRLQKFDLAKKEIDELLTLYPRSIPFLLAKAEIEYESKNTEMAFKTYENALKLYPANSSIMYDYISALLKAKKFKQADNLLNTFLKEPAQNPEFYKFQAEAKSALQQPALSHEALAEYYFQTGQFHQAIDQINLALKSDSNDFYTTARLEARLAYIKEEIPREQQ